ncbi:MAG: V-type ATP synthase subunit F, partial [Candidatus Poseidoniales archaeon]
MEIAVIGSPAFTLGFQLAGLSNLYNPDGEEELHSTLRSLLNNKSVGIMVVDSAVMATVSDRLRDQLS